MEFWVNYFCESARKFRYLVTVELNAKLNIEEFLLDTSVKSVQDLKLVDADAIYDATSGLLEKNCLDMNNILYIMTDNCNVMKGKTMGFKLR